MINRRGRGLEDLQRMRDMRRARKKHGRWNQLRRIMQRRKAMQARQQAGTQLPRFQRPPFGGAGPVGGGAGTASLDTERARREAMERGVAGPMKEFPSPQPERQPYSPSNQQGYGGIATGMAHKLQQMQTPEQRRAQAQAIGGGMRDLMNSGGADLPPQDGNPYSPTGGQGFNLANMIRRRRNRWS